MACSIEVQDVFGPAVAVSCQDGFDFTLLFEQLILTILPNAVLFILVPARLWQLSRRFVVRQSNFICCRLKLAAYVVFSATQLVLLVILCVPGFVPKTRACIPAQALVLAAAPLCLALSRQEHSRSPRPSTLLSLYFGLTLLFDIVRARTLWLVPGNQPVAIGFCVGLFFKLVLLVVESFQKRSPSLDSIPSREATGSVVNRASFWWLNALLWHGFRHLLTVDYLPTIDPELGTYDFYRRLWTDWNLTSHQTAGTFIKLVVSAHKYGVLQGVMPRLALSGFTFAQPFLISRVVNFATVPGGSDKRLDEKIGNSLIVATAIIYVGLAVTNATAQHKTFRVISKLRATMVSLIYYKTLVVPLSVAQESSAITLMSADVERSGTGLRLMHELWASPMDLGIGFFLLQRQLGPAAAAPGVLFLICSAVGLTVAASMARRQRLWLEAIERRIRVTSNTLSAMKEVRTGGLYASRKAQLRGLRDKEIMASRPFKNALAIVVCLSYTTAAMGPVFSFGIFSLLAKRNNTEPLTADKGFTSLALFSLIRSPMAMILDVLAGLVGSLGAMQRVGEYLATEPRLHSRCPVVSSVPMDKTEPGKTDICHNKAEVMMVSLPHQDENKLPSQPPSELEVMATQYSAGWDRDKAFILQNMTFSIPRGSLVFVIGPVGCGKSTLLHAILGETTVDAGHLRTSGCGMAFVGQSPWLISDTIQNNIVGTESLTQSWYNQVVDACALREDFANMAHGDQEMVDGTGSNLSGGQRARLALARALYSRRKLVLLDDVFSGLDARTEEAIFANLFGTEGLLRRGDRTTIFATNAVHRLSAADHILVLSADNRLLEQGPYDRLRSTANYLQTVSSEKGRLQGPSPPEPTSLIQNLPKDLLPTQVMGTQRQTGDTAVYKYYAQAVGCWNLTFFILFGAVFVFALIFPQYLVKWWAEENARQPHGLLGRYLGSYFGLAWLAILGLAMGCLHLVARMMPRASTAFHTTLLETALNAPLSLFAGSSLGTTINRFSQDLQLIDMELPLAFFNTSIELLSSLANLLMIAIAAGVFGAALPVVLVIFYLVQKYYLRTARQMRLLDIEAKAPLVSHCLETLSGIAAIRAYGAEADYERRFMQRLNRSQKPFYLLYAIQRWLNLVLDLIVAGIAVVFMSIAIKARGNIDPTLIGTALVGTVNFSVSIKALLENWTNLEVCVGAVSRVRSFALETPTEHKPGEDLVPPVGWPIAGHIAFQGVTATWEGKDVPVIKDFSLDIQPGEKLAICGRTGSGKSSLVSLLFRLLEHQTGAISIDGIDITLLQRQELRERLICVPQAPTLQIGTVRENVDPFGVATDKAILETLNRVRMQAVIQNAGGLDATIDNETFSVGQKQLLCLARALLRSGTVLVLDEVTSSLDWETDAIVREVIDSAFQHHTVIAITHRGSSIVNYDRVAVIVEGRLAECGQPAYLLENPDSLFAKLYQLGSETSKETIDE